MMRRLVLQKGNTGRHWYEDLSTKQQVVSCSDGKMSFLKKAEDLGKALEDVGSAMSELSKGSKIFSGNVHDAEQAAEIKKTWKLFWSPDPPLLSAETSQSIRSLHASQSPLPSPAKSSPSSPLPAAQSSFLPTLNELISGMDILLSIRVSAPDKLLIEVKYSDDKSVFDLKISDKATGKCVAMFPELSSTTFDANEICKEFVEGNRLKLLLVDRKIPPSININHGKQEKELDK